jgi:glyoxylase-like metal-dependent hydrolase (beta-lactamase superfamily II)
MNSKPHIRMLTGIFLITSVTMGCASTQQRGASGNNATFDPSAQVEAATPPPTAAKTHVPVLEEVRADAIPVDPDVGVGTIALKDGTYVVTDGIWQSAFVVTSRGVIVLDAPESFGTKLHDAIAAVTDQPIKVLVYSHAHKDHIGGSATFAGIPGLKIVALDSVRRFLEQKQDPKRLVPNSTFSEAKTIRLGGKTVALKRHRNYHANEGDLFIYVPESKFLMAVDTLAPAYVPFMNLDLTSNFHEYLKVFDDILGYDFDVFLGGHLTQLGDRADVMARTAEAEGGWDNKYLLFQAFLDQVTAKAVAEVQARWIDKLAGVDVFVDSHIRTALIYVRWDD